MKRWFIYGAKIGSAEIPDAFDDSTFATWQAAADALAEKIDKKLAKARGAVALAERQWREVQAMREPEQ